MSRHFWGLCLQAAKAQGKGSVGWVQAGQQTRQQQEEQQLNALKALEANSGGTRIRFRCAAKTYPGNARPSYAAALPALVLWGAADRSGTLI